MSATTAELKTIGDALRHDYCVRLRTLFERLEAHGGRRRDIKAAFNRAGGTDTDWVAVLRLDKPRAGILGLFCAVLGIHGDYLFTGNTADAWLGEGVSWEDWAKSQARILAPNTALFTTS